MNAMQKTFDRAAEDLGNSIHLEHVNVTIPDQRIAQLFYGAGLGLTRDPHDFFQGRGFTRVNLRHRLTRRLDYDLAHTYQVRWSPNQVKRDHSVLFDQGLEINQLSWVGSYRGDALSGRLTSVAP